jgi:hypothetical protein
LVSPRTYDSRDAAPDGPSAYGPTEADGVLSSEEHLDGPDPDDRDNVVTLTLAGVGAATVLSE